MGITAIYKEGERRTIKNAMIQTGLVKDEIAKPLDEKLELAKQVIVKHLWEFKTDEMFVAWSGGKDSTFLLALVRQFEPNIPVVFNDTGIEYKQTIQFINKLKEEWNLNLTIVKPKKTFWEIVEQYGFPHSTRLKGEPKCCRYLKINPIREFVRQKGMKASFIGITAFESRTRMFAAIRYGICHHSNYYGLCRIKPILYFRPDEIWYLTEKWNIPINEGYQITPRIGCQPCTGHSSWEQELAISNPKLYDLVQRKRGGEYQLALWR